MLGVAVLCFVLALVVLVLVFGSAPPSSGVSITSAGAAGATIEVYVVGAVERPGVYTLPANARVQQLLDAAGGALPDADMIAVNPAATISDGEEVYVPRIGETLPGNVGTAGAKVNINTATVSQMQTLLHVSKTTAEHIVSYRQSHGPFTAVAQLLAIPISQSIFDRIKDQVTT
jgi:competence protein ComEA